MGDSLFQRSASQLALNKKRDALPQKGPPIPAALKPVPSSTKPPSSPTKPLAPTRPPTVASPKVSPTNPPVTKAVNSRQQQQQPQHQQQGVKSNQAVPRLQQAQVPKPVSTPSQAVLSPARQPARDLETKKTYVDEYGRTFFMEAGKLFMLGPEGQVFEVQVDDAEGSAGNNSPQMRRKAAPPSPPINRKGVPKLETKELPPIYSEKDLQELYSEEVDMFGKKKKISSPRFPKKQYDEEFAQVAETGGKKKRRGPSTQTKLNPFALYQEEEEEEDDDETMANTLANLEMMEKEKNNSVPVTKKGNKDSLGAEPKKGILKTSPRPSDENDSRKGISFGKEEEPIQTISSPPKPREELDINLMLKKVAISDKPSPAPQGGRKMSRTQSAMNVKKSETDSINQTPSQSNKGLLGLLGKMSKSSMSLKPEDSNTSQPQPEDNKKAKRSTSSKQMVDKGGDSLSSSDSSQKAALQRTQSYTKVPAKDSLSNSSSPVVTSVDRTRASTATSVNTNNNNGIGASDGIAFTATPSPKNSATSATERTRASTAAVPEKKMSRTKSAITLSASNDVVPLPPPTSEFLPKAEVKVTPTTPAKPNVFSRAKSSYNVKK